MKRHDHKVTKLKCTVKEVAYTSQVAMSHKQECQVQVASHDSEDNIDRTREMEPHDLLISFDAINLSTQVPIGIALEVIVTRVTVDGSLREQTTIPTPQVVELV